MRTKPCEGVLRADLVSTVPRAEAFIVYDGLAGLSYRRMLRDVLEELQRQGPEPRDQFLEVMRRRGSGRLFVEFSDYVSYGIGGGDAIAELSFGSFLMLHMKADGELPERLVLMRPEAIEQFSLDGNVIPPPPTRLE